MTEKQTIRTATGRDIPLTVERMPVLELRHYDWLIDTLREESGYGGNIRGHNVYFAETGAFLGFILSDGIQIHAEWFDDSQNDTFPVGPARRWQHALSYMIDRWDWAHGRILPTQEPGEDDESLNERRRAVISAHTVPGRPAPSAVTLAEETAKADAAALVRLWDEAERRAAYLAAVKTHPFGLAVEAVELPAFFHVTDTAKTQRTGECWHPQCTQPAPVEIRRDPWQAQRGPWLPGYRACAFHYLQAAEKVRQLTSNAA